MRVAHILLPFALALPALAQEMEIPKPAKELAKYQKLIGSWEGSGQVWMEAGATPTAWTASSTCKEILGGFFFQEDTEVDLGGEFTTPLQMRALHGFDNERQSYIMYGVSNNGIGNAEQAYWVGDTLVVSGSGLDPESGLPYVDRTLIKYGKDSYDLEIDRAVGDGDFFTHVSGTFKRAKTAKAGFAREASFMQMPVAPAMGSLGKICGKFDIVGSMIPMPAGAVSLAGPLGRATPLGRRTQRA